MSNNEQIIVNIYYMSAGAKPAAYYLELEPVLNGDLHKQQVSEVVLVSIWPAGTTILLVNVKLFSAQKYFYFSYTNQSLVSRPYQSSLLRT